MELLTGLFLGIIWVLGIIFLRSITTFFHEMGHAIPALLFTKKEKVNVLVGTYGDISDCLQINLGRLALYLKLNVFNWRIGLCTHGQVKGLIPRLMVILGGPIASVLIGGIALYIIIAKDFSQGWLIFAVLFLISAIFDFLVNIDPSHTPIKLYDGSVTYSDGYQLVNAIKYKNLPETYYKAEKLFFKKEVDQAKAICESLVKEKIQHKPVYDLLIQCYIEQKAYVDALEFYESIKSVQKYSYIDFYQIGWLNLQLDHWDLALPYFDHCVYEQHNDTNALSHRGYISIQKGDFQRAEQDLLAATTYDPNHPTGWSNFGLLKVKIGQLEKANRHLQRAFALAPEDPNVLYHMGLYYEEQRDYKNALTYFKKAKELGLTYHGIDLKIADVEGFLTAFF